MAALPIEAEIHHLHRQYLANVIYTIVGEAFADWVDALITERNRKVTVESNEMVKMDPRVAAIFRASTTTSSK